MKFAEFIPQVYFDAIARIASGMILLTSITAIWRTELSLLFEHFAKVFDAAPAISSMGTLIIAYVLAIGFEGCLDELKRCKKIVPPILRQPSHKELQVAQWDEAWSEFCDAYTIDSSSKEARPSDAVAIDVIRILNPDVGARIVKLRAEVALCRVLSVGWTVLLLILVLQIPLSFVFPKILSKPLVAFWLSILSVAVCARMISNRKTSLDKRHLRALYNHWLLLVQPGIKGISKNEAGVVRFSAKDLPPCAVFYNQKQDHLNSFLANNSSDIHSNGQQIASGVNAECNIEAQNEMAKTIISRFGPTSVETKQFFISWNSVATLAYKCFSRTLIDIKRDIEDGIPGLKTEEPGSRWPKTTLGCLREGIELNEDQVSRLRNICTQQSSNLQYLADSDRSMDIKELCCVTFHCRTLERRIASQVIPLGGRSTADDSPPHSHLNTVAETLAQFKANKHTSYYPKLATKGRTINAYYRVPHIESTLIYDLKPSNALADIILTFRQAVDEALPGCYAWFDPNSWHITVRALLAV